MASLQRTEIFANTDPEAEYLFGQQYANQTDNPRHTSDGEAVPFDAVVRRTCPVDSAQIVTDMYGLRQHIYSKHKIVREPVNKSRAWSWA